MHQNGLQNLQAGLVVAHHVLGHLVPKPQFKVGLHRRPLRRGHSHNGAKQKGRPVVEIVRTGHDGDVDKGKVGGVNGPIQIQRPVRLEKGHSEPSEDVDGFHYGCCCCCGPVQDAVVLLCTSGGGGGGGGSCGNGGGRHEACGGDETGVGVEGVGGIRRRRGRGHDPLGGFGSRRLDIGVQQLLDAVATALLRYRQRRRRGGGVVRGWWCLAAGARAVLLNLLACIQQGHDAINLFLQLADSSGWMSACILQGGQRGDHLRRGPPPPPRIDLW